MKFLLIIITIFFSVAILGQTPNSVFLKWKLLPKETLSYKTVMEEIDLEDYQDISFDIDEFYKIFEDSTKSKTINVKTLFSDINKSLKNYDLIINMAERKKGVIDVELREKKKEESKSLSKEKDTTNTNDNLIEMMSQMNGDVMLRGAVNENGFIQSFYVRNDQKNLIAIFFELPNKQISIGDKWKLDVNLISMDQNFTCDTSYKRNLVTLIDLKKTGNDTIAVIKYDIVEYVSGNFKNPFSKSDKKTTMKMIYNGLAEFSINKGRWISYDGIMSLNSTGVMTSSSTKKITLLIN